MKLARLVNPRFHSTLDKLATQPLPAKVTFRLKGIVKVVNEEFAKYEEVRKEALQKFAKKDADGNLELDEKQNALFEGDGLSNFLAEINALLNEEVEVPKIKLSELGDNCTLSLEDLNSLDGLIEE